MNNNFVNIAGYEKEKKELISLRELLVNYKQYEAMGIRIPRGVLLYGVPGVGKTAMARSIAAEGIHLIELRSSAGSQETDGAYITAAFEEARNNAPALIIIDELDKIAATSEKVFRSKNEDVMKILLTELESEKNGAGVLVVATCNECVSINPALLRTGRFDRIIEITTPSLEDRVTIIRHYLSKISLESRLDVEYLAKITVGNSGSYIECVINEAAIMAIQEGAGYIDMAMVQKAMNRIAFRALEGKIPDGDALWKIAVHEAGHAVVGALLLPNELTGATVIPNGSVKGHVTFAPTDDQFDTVSVIESRIKVTVAGSAAEELVIGERSIGALTDLRHARKMLVTLVFGLGAYNIRYAGIYTTLPVAKAASEYILSRGDEIYLAKMEELYNKSRTILQENKEAVLAVARALMAKSSLSAEEIFEICGTVGGSAA